MDGTVSTIGKRKVTKKPTGAKAKPALSKQPSKEKKSAKAPEADEVPDIESDQSVASSTSGKKKVNKNPKVKPVLTKQPSKEGNAAESKKPTVSYLDMVQEAIEAVGVPRKGASAQAIKKYIYDKKEDGGKIDIFVNKALIKGVEKGVLQKTNKIDRGGAIGSFALVKLQKPKKIPKTQAKDSDDDGGPVSDSETFIKPKHLAHFRRRNLSDSAIPELTSSTPKPKLEIKKTPRILTKAIKPKKVVKEDDEKEVSSDSEFEIKPNFQKGTRLSSSDTELNLFSKAKKTKTASNTELNLFSKAKKTKTETEVTKKTRGAETKAKKGEKAELLPPKQPKPRVKKLHNPDAKDETKKPAAAKGGKAKSKKKA